jgi:hypothetical protein
MVNNVSFNGVTGPMVLSKGFSQYLNAGRNTRSGGTVFKILILRCTAPGTHPRKILWFPLDTSTHIRRHLNFVARTVPCFLPIFTSATDGSQYIPPPDFNPTISVKLAAAGSARGSFSTSSILIFLLFRFVTYVVIHRRSNIIKAFQPRLLYCILIGGLLGAARILVGGTDKNDELCDAEFWVCHLAFIVMIGSLFVKSYCVHCIVNSKGLRHVTLSAFDAIKLLAAIADVSVIYLIISSMVGKPGMRHLRSFKANQETHWKGCGMEYPQFQTALFAVEVFFLTTGFRVCWEIRNVPDIVNESKQISTLCHLSF